jgi:hypothetical protein
MTKPTNARKRSQTFRSRRPEHQQPNYKRPTLISETTTAQGKRPNKKKRAAPRSDLPLRPCRCKRPRRIWARARQWRGDLGADRRQWLARPGGLANQGTGEVEGRSWWFAASVFVLYGAGSVAVGEKVIRERRGASSFLPRLEFVCC